MNLNIKDLRRILYGAAFLGSGGGGLIKSGEVFIERIALLTKQVKLITFPFSKEDADLFGCIICDIGSITSFDDLQDEALNFAYKVLNHHFEELGEKRIKAFFPIETGPENTLAPFMLAAMTNFVVVDGDGAGRAVPTLPLSTFAVGGVKYPEPISISNGKGDSMLVFTKNAENVLRSITGSNVFNNSSSLALWPNTVDEIYKNCIPGTISMALHCGQLLEGIKLKKKDLIKKSLPIVNTLSGYIIGKGEVIFKTQSEKGSFNFTTTKVKQDDGSVITVISQNESLIVYNDLSISPIALAPDSICFLGYDFIPFTNGEINEIDYQSTAIKQKIYIIGVKAHVKLNDRKIRYGFKKIIEELGYAGNMDVSPIDTMPLGELFSKLKK